MEEAVDEHLVELEPGLEGIKGLFFLYKLADSPTFRQLKGSWENEKSREEVLLKKAVTRAAAQAPTK